eukprot:SAG31_NODE_3971_length_3705_cov_3.354964_1_plen_72_part_00
MVCRIGASAAATQLQRSARRLDTAPRTRRGAIKTGGVGTVVGVGGEGWLDGGEMARQGETYLSRRCASAHL